MYEKGGDFGLSWQWHCYCFGTYTFFNIPSSNRVLSCWRLYGKTDCRIICSLHFCQAFTISLDAWERDVLFEESRSIYKKWISESCLCQPFFVEKNFREKVRWCMFLTSDCSFHVKDFKTFFPSQFTFIWNF